MKTAELARVKPLASIWGKKDDGCGYKERWPESDASNADWKGSTLQRWEWELEAKLRGSGKTIPVIDIMAHVFKESERVMVGTTHEHDFVVFHDALSAWWEKKAQVGDHFFCVCFLPLLTLLSLRLLDCICRHGLRPSMVASG